MNPNDFVRLEIEAALQRQIPVTPLLVDGAAMPREDQLPPTLHPLLDKNATALRHGKDFRPDVQRLVAGLHEAAAWYRSTAAGERRDASPPVLGDVVKLVPAAPLPGALLHLFLDEKKEVPITFAYCPPGTFQMGSPDSDDEKPVHSVTLTKGFYAGIHQVTQAQWRAVMGTSPSKSEFDTLPVEQISWDDAVAFCAKVKEKTGKAVRLLTEAEWEYACRAGTTTQYWSGDTKDELKEVGWYLEDMMNMEYSAQPVGEKLANGFGLYDMHGNVMEWCADWFGSYPGGAVVDPVGPASGSHRVNRGGSWLSIAPMCRSAYRRWKSPDHRDSILGFRLAVGSPGPQS